jgi:ATP-dependent exoDNAse (exonuclease V) alpha subunit
MQKKFDTEAAERLGLPIPSKLFPLRASAERLNAQMFSQIAAPVMEYPIEINRNNTLYLDEGVSIPTDILRECHKLTEHDIGREIGQMVENSPCIENLALKEGTLVMLCYNLNLDIGLCNGSQGVVVGFQQVPQGSVVEKCVRADVLYPKVKFTNGMIVVITPREYQSTNYPTLSFSQIPLKLAWGLTIHSSQGATLDIAEIDIGAGIFEVGQTYVALSRVRSLDGLYLLGYDPTKIKVSRKVIEFYRALPEIK